MLKCYFRFSCKSFWHFNWLPRFFFSLFFFFVVVCFIFICFSAWETLCCLNLPAELASQQLNGIISLHYYLLKAHAITIIVNATTTTTITATSIDGAITTTTISATFSFLCIIFLPLSLSLSANLSIRSVLCLIFCPIIVCWKSVKCIFLDYIEHTPLAQWRI